jgi:hypothetical protein
MIAFMLTTTHTVEDVGRSPNRQKHFLSVRKKSTMGVAVAKIEDAVGAVATFFARRESNPGLLYGMEMMMMIMCALTLSALTTELRCFVENKEEGVTRLIELSPLRCPGVRATFLATRGHTTAPTGCDVEGKTASTLWRRQKASVSDASPSRLAHWRRST